VVTDNVIYATRLSVADLQQPAPLSPITALHPARRGPGLAAAQELAHQQPTKQISIYNIYSRTGERASITRRRCCKKQQVAVPPFSSVSEPLPDPRAILQRPPWPGLMHEATHVAAVGTLIFRPGIVIAGVALAPSRRPRGRDARCRILKVGLLRRPPFGIRLHRLQS